MKRFLVFIAIMMLVVPAMAIEVDFVPTFVYQLEGATSIMVSDVLGHTPRFTKCIITASSGAVDTVTIRVFYKGGRYNIMSFVIQDATDSPKEWKFTGAKMDSLSVTATSASHYSTILIAK